MYFLVFHGEERFGKAAAHGDHHASHATSHAADDHHDEAHDDAHAEEHHGLAPGQKPHETPWVVTLPLILLAIPSAIIGFITIEPMLFGDFFKGAIFVDSEAHPVMDELAHHFHGAFAMATHAVTTAVFWLALLGVVAAWYLYMKRPDIPVAIKARFGGVYTLLDNKYYFDKFNEVVFAGGARLLGRGLWKGGDVGVIDGMIVNGAVRLVSWFATLARFFQTGHIYHYAFTMIIGVFVLMTLWVTRA
jgi:NADH-quinone oxidoreductase subunit L